MKELAGKFPIYRVAVWRAGIPYFVYEGLPPALSWCQPESIAFAGD